MSAHKKRGGLFTLFKKKGEKNDKQESIKARKESVTSRESGVISTEDAKEKSTRMQSTDKDIISQCTISSVVRNGILPNANMEIEHRKSESPSLDSTSQLTEIENYKKSREDVEMKTKDGQETENNSNDRNKFDAAISNIDATTHILAESHDISNKPTDIVQDVIESEQRDKILEGEGQQQQSHMNVADIVKHEEHDNSGLKHEEMKTYEVDEVTTRAGKYSPIPSDPSLTPLAASDNQSESTIDEGKVVSEESEEVLNPRSITHPNGSFPVAEPSSLGGNRDVHVLVDHTSPTSGKVFQFSEDKRSLSVRNLGPEEKPLVGPLQDASSTLRSVSMASLPHDDGKKTSRNADSSTAGQRKFYEVGIIHYAPERFAGVKERNAQFGGLSPPPIKKDLKTNVIITEQQNRPELLSAKDEQLAKEESIAGDEEDPLQKEYTKLRILFEQWQSHCTDPIAVKKAYTLKLQGELIAQLKLVQDLCSKVPPQQLVNQPALTIPMLSAPLKKRPAIINHKFAPPSPKLPTSPQVSPKSERKTLGNNQSAKPPDNKTNSSQKKNASSGTTTSGAARSTIGRPHLYTPLMKNEFHVPRMREPNNFEPHTIAVSSYRQRPELHTISYGTTTSESADLRTQEGSTTVASEAERDWRNRNAEIAEIDTKGWVTSTLRLGSSAAEIERHDEKENAFRRIQREIEMEAQRQREFNRMRQQLSTVTTIQEEIEDDEQKRLKGEPLKEEPLEKSSSQPSIQRTSKALSYAKQFDAKVAEKVNPTRNVLRSSHASAPHEEKKVPASTNRAQVDDRTKSVPSGGANVKQSIKNISKNFTKSSSQEISKVQVQRPNSIDNIKQIVEKGKLGASSQCDITDRGATSTNKPELLNAPKVPGNRFAIRDNGSIPASIRKNDRSSIIEADQGKRSTTRSSDQHSASSDTNCNVEAQRSITTNIRSVISSAKNSTMRSEDEGLSMSAQKNQQRNIASNDESYGKGAQRWGKDNSEDKLRHSCGGQFAIPELRKIGTPVERIGIQLGFVREDKEDVDRDEKAGTSTSTSTSTQQQHSSKLASVSSVDESGNSATICSSSVAPPPPPPGPAPIIAHLRSPRSECSLSSWGQSAGSEHGPYSSLTTPGVESADERKERFRKSLSHLATIDPAVLLAEMKEVHLKPTHPVQKSKSSESTDLRSNLMREICEAGGAKSLKKTSTPT